ncbi:MAG: UDP-3-O-(3-hydroxymyristoyl)glucosamine N-acyltransferase [Moraxellaceae bacterium]|nr:UDP-3-O-(3-hydroxymyristoyl)glucosamine N-acyltransferase [Moraxellaceae bacterium]
MLSAKPEFTLQALAEKLGAQLRGNAAHCINGLGTLSNAQSQQIAFLANPRYKPQLATTNAGAVLLTPADAENFSGNALVLANPYLAFAQLTALFDQTPQPALGIHASASVSATAMVPASARIGAGVVIGEEVVLGERCVIDAGAVLHDRVSVGDDCRIHSNVVVHHDCVLGNRVNICAGAIIGADGFGFANDRGRWQKIYQLGRVVIGSDVDIGANTTIDRGALEDTEIHDQVIIDNQVQIAHNVVVGQGTAIAACCGISGSSRIGRYCILAGGVGLVGHIEICDHVQITGMTMVTKSITEPGSYSSGTAFDHTDKWKKMAVRLRRLDDLATRVRNLEQGKPSL